MAGKAQGRDAQLKRIAIVSSYSESCGNAAFTRVLHDSIEGELGHQVEVVELDLRVLQSANPTIRAKGDEHIKQLCKQLASFDLVNLQFEGGLYGTLPGDIKRRLRWLLVANPNTTITFHSPRLMEATTYGMRSAIKKLLSFKIKSGLRELSASMIAGRHISVNRFVARTAVKFGARFIVHTERARKQIQQFHPAANVEVHPLKIVPQEYRGDDKWLKSVKKRLNLQEADVVIGIFGYISAYKGHHDALKALELLPSNFKLLVFGRQHPQTLRSDGRPDPYIDKLVTTTLKSPSIRDRVFFLGELNDEQFINVAGSVDVAWLPYYENGQDGSGIASICFDVSRQIVCSTSLAFDELFKLIPYMNYERFDIGNYLELATKTKMAVKAPQGDNLVALPSMYSVRTQAKIYALEFGAHEEPINA
jgi:glycosyltransferase involved in cell wall biosynthesis